MKHRLAGVLCLTMSTVAAAQGPAAAGRFDAGQSVAGVVVGFGSIGSAGAAIGGRFEHAIKPLPDMGNGILALALDIDAYHYSEKYGSSSVSLTYVPIGVSVNYHFRLDDRRLDPFIGAGLGYAIASASGGGSSYTASSDLYLITRIGARYFYSSTAALQADAGAGSAALSLGLVWKL